MARLTDAKVDRQIARPAARSVPARKGPAVLERVTRYLHEVRGELSRVDWPSRPELIAMTLVVVVILLAMSLYLGAVDAVFSWLFQRVLIRR